MGFRHFTCTELTHACSLVQQDGERDQTSVEERVEEESVAPPQEEDPLEDDVQLATDFNIDEPTSVEAPASLTCAEAASSRPSWVNVGAHVMFKDSMHGMIAEISELNGNVLVAADDGSWHTIEPAALLRTIEYAPSIPPREPHVVAITHELGHGMLIGYTDEFAFGGTARSFHAHYARAPNADSIRFRSRAGDRRSKTQSFQLGDVVSNSPTGVRAAVVRVVYKERVGSSQARKFLILCELDASAETPVLSSPPDFFPASWANWSRVSLTSSQSLNNEGVLTMDHTTIVAMEKVRLTSYAYAVSMLSSD